MGSFVRMKVDTLAETVVIKSAFMCNFHIN